MYSRENIFSWLCWAVAAYFAYAALWPFFPPQSVIDGGHYTFLILAVFFFVVPVAQKIEIFKFLTFESRLSEIDGKQKRHDAEIKHLQSIQATLTQSLSNVNSNTASVQNNFYGREEALKGVSADLIPSTAATKTSVQSTSENPTMAFDSAVPSENNKVNPFERAFRNVLQVTPLQDVLLLSVDLQSALRLAVGKNLLVYHSRKDAKYLTSSQLHRMFLRQYPEKGTLTPSFQYFFNVANAAAHGQLIPDQDLVTAVIVGRKLLEEVSNAPTKAEGSIEPEDED
ncbi:hypothetical protein G6L94_31225 [Agrobacterium rhizogenes]|jgi:hypothetical protein|uniref:hypothetical protein n=1 Tax=Rhizobium rhizogenes TaxID=359 RepID=UPI00080F7605|nr:hypothetical protein [Rhizobium rhizogenes]OCJ22152.1 hypothetical protein A6U88_30245 [Agrobacterium sp. B131/95]OCJ27314.1 hypothetical protein A6U89_29520 [Agrobacterium sp. B133/95]NTI46115.1 hypothetical protein [Rhizobium rhizogenes]NTI52799.1 hypothetical protein [Rhizobium rhizogenes]NTI98172.1 hypothetical protein [Rhizobium rhizogenes]